MINKINNNISFKGVYLVPSINYLNETNKHKAGIFAKIAKQAFPQNDIFIGADKDGELCIRVQKSNPLHLLMDTEIAAKMNLTPIQLASLINFITDYNSAHNRLWGIHEPFMLDKTENINDMDMMDVSFQFCRVIDLFNQTHKELEN